MKPTLLLLFALACSMPANEIRLAAGQPGSVEKAPEPPNEKPKGGEEEGKPWLLRLSAKVDGSGRIRFTRKEATYHHLHWESPEDVKINGVAWTDLSVTPRTWAEIADSLDLTKAWIVKRSGRDVIAIESTPDGFDLYLSDSPNGAAEYEITIAIPRRP